jgi:hypothetical protein
VTLPAGVVLLLLGLLAMLVSAHFKGLRYFDRPTPARNAYFDPIIDVLKWCLVTAGLVLLWRASRPSFVAAGAVLLTLWSYRGFVRSRFLQGRLLRRDFAALRRTHPGMSDGEILYELAYRRHARWGPELLEQMVKDYPTVEELSRMMVRMERGFRGFRGRRPAASRGGGRGSTPGAE